MRIIITGTSGMVAPEIWRALEAKHELWAVGRNQPSFVPDEHWRELDITDAEKVLSVIPKINPDLVIHSAALSRPDDCERDPILGYRTNSLGTRNLTLACQKFDAEIVLLSTDQVFDGEKKVPYTELDAPRSLNHYGKSKIWAEDFVRTLSRRHYIVRTSLVFGRARPSFIDACARAILQEGKVEKPLVAAVDLINSPTSAVDLARGVAFLIETGLYGTYHVAGAGQASRWQMAEFVAQCLGLPLRGVVSGSYKDVAFAAPRAGFIALDNFNWKLNGFPALRSWQEMAKEYLLSSASVR